MSGRDCETELTQLDRNDAIARALRLIEDFNDGRNLDKISMHDLHAAVTMFYYYNRWRELIHKLEGLVQENM